MAKVRKAVVAPRYRLRVKQRLAIVEYAVAHSLLAASRRFGLDRKSIREWRDRWRQQEIAGLVPRYPTQRKSRVPEDVMRLLEHARRELGYGAPRTRIWLRRVHKRDLAGRDHPEGVRLGLPRLPRSRRRAAQPRQLRLFEMPTPGDSVQVDRTFRSS
jgi:transposase